jgi:hypothetical protein
VPGIGNPSPLRGDKKEEGGDAFHGFRVAQSGPAPPVATPRRPVGAFTATEALLAQVAWCHHLPRRGRDTGLSLSRATGSSGLGDGDEPVPPRFGVRSTRARSLIGCPAGPAPRQRSWSRWHGTGATLPPLPRSSPPKRVVRELGEDVTRRRVARPDLDELTQQIIRMHPAVAVVNEVALDRFYGLCRKSTDGITHTSRLRPELTKTKETRSPMPLGLKQTHRYGSTTA